MVDVLIAEPGELSDTCLAAAEALVRSAFGSSFRSHDWLHAVDGVHVVVSADRALLAFAAITPRILHHNGLPLDTGYVEGVAVRRDQQGQGLGGILMDHAEKVIRTRHKIGALNAIETAAGFYDARGWEPWPGHTQAASPAGIVDTYDSADRIYLLHPHGQVKALDANVSLICDWRRGDAW